MRLSADKGGLRLWLRWPWGAGARGALAASFSRRRGDGGPWGRAASRAKRTRATALGRRRSLGLCVMAQLWDESAVPGGPVVRAPHRLSSLRYRRRLGSNPRGDCSPIGFEARHLEPVGELSRVDKPQPARSPGRALRRAGRVGGQPIVLLRGAQVEQRLPRSGPARRWRGRAHPGRRAARLRPGHKCLCGHYMRQARPLSAPTVSA